MIDKIKKIVERYKGKINKYYLTVFIFFIITFFIGDSNLYKRYQYDEKINYLNSEIEKYRKEIDANKTKLNDLHTDDENLERFAREQFLMAKPNEEVYIIK